MIYSSIDKEDTVILYYDDPLKEHRHYYEYPVIPNYNRHVDDL